MSSSLGSRAHASSPSTGSSWPSFLFYALENAVVAAADRLGLSWKPTHPSKVEVARLLTGQHGLPDIGNLLLELNELRKSEAYGEVLAPTDLDAEDIASAVEEYVGMVEAIRTK